MAQRDLLNRSLDAGKDVTQRTQDAIEGLLREVAKNAEDQAAQAQHALAELLERSRSNTEQLIEAVDREIRAQITAVGLATKTDIRRLERHISNLRSGSSPDSAAERAVQAVTRSAPVKKVAEVERAARKAGGATRTTVERAGRKVTKRAGGAVGSASKRATTTKATATKKATTAKRSTAKKATAAKATATKKASATTQSTAKKATTAKRSTAKKATIAKATATKKATAAKRSVAAKKSASGRR